MCVAIIHRFTPLFAISLRNIPEFTYSFYYAILLIANLQTCIPIHLCPFENFSIFYQHRSWIVGSRSMWLFTYVKWGWKFFQNICIHLTLHQMCISVLFVNFLYLRCYIDYLKIYSRLVHTQWFFVLFLACFPYY